jgi:phosphatidate cytidylyltransferase
MSSMPDVARTRAAAPHRGQSDGWRERFRFNMDWITRPLFGFLLAGIAIGATVLGGLAFVVFISLGCAAAIREWHRLFAKRDFLLPAAITVVTMVAALSWQLYFAPSGGPAARFAPAAILLVGCLCNLLVGISRREAPFAHAAAPLYIALPALSLLMLRQSPEHPVWLVLMVFLAVWATDTGALFSGNLIGGPKLAPTLSPNKTWAGFVGGVACAALITGAVAAVLKTNVAAAALFGVALALAGHAGDLFESMIKRRTGRKDSGGLIPGHGGVLDRIDSILFASPAAALLVLVLALDPLAGHRP